MRIMALDYGDARTGVAISDERGILCGETQVIAEWDAARLAERAASLARERGCGLVVLGLPRNMDGSEGPRAEKCRAFAALLAEHGAPEVRLCDERRTSVEAHNILRANGRREKQHQRADKADKGHLQVEGPEQAQLPQKEGPQPKPRHQIGGDGGQVDELDGAGHQKPRDQADGKGNENLFHKTVRGQAP